jgi:ribonuclease HII
MSVICGIDEAGRGPLAGPVCAGAVILFNESGAKDFPLELLNDSKKLKAANREKARLVICTRAAAWGIGWASAEEIDRINILKASLLAMKRAYEAMIVFLCQKDPPFCQKDVILQQTGGLKAIVDGLYTPDIPIQREAMVKADAKVPEVMAASILAKTARDRMMDRYGWLYPEYGYEKHKGYPTTEHREKVILYGPSPIQRMSFRVKK